jgi:hypothetical protein
MAARGRRETREEPVGLDLEESFALGLAGEPVTAEAAALEIGGGRFAEGGHGLAGHEDLYAVRSRARGRRCGRPGRCSRRM